MRVATACLALLLAITVLSVQAQDNKAAKVSHLRAARETDADPEAKRKGKDGRKKKGGKPKKAIAKKEGRKGRMQGRGIVVNGNDCEYITLKDITGNSGCSSGQKFVLKGSSGVRRQFLIVSDNVILAFVVKKKKFTECTAFTDITTSVTCKSIDGLDSVDLSVTAASNSSATNAAATTAAGAAATTAAGAAATTAAGAAATTAAGAAATTAVGAAATTAAGAAATTAAGAAATTAAGAAATTAAGTQQPGSCAACGVKKTSRIVGGAEATVNEYPWIAIFGDSTGDNLGGCSSTLIGSKWALTASHCFFDQTTNQQNQFPADMTVVLGIHDRTVVVTPDTPQSARKVLKISEIIIHPSYNQATSSANDIALLKLEEVVDVATYMPACLPSKGDDFSGKNAWVYGWGVKQENGDELAEKLQELKVPVVADSVCSPPMAAEGVEITPDMLCAGGVEGKDSCGGDSGGPLTVEVAGKNGDVHVLAGAVSFGIGCARAELYGVYAEVAMFREWIDQTIQAKGGDQTICPAQA